MSPSSRRAWIEIAHADAITAAVGVALLAEGVDRNNTVFNKAFEGQVALLAEGVDRNISVPLDRMVEDKSPSSRRAWIEITFVRYPADTSGSPSSRRAWIEIEQ
mgnify:CR=1 FL=1